MEVDCVATSSHQSMFSHIVACIQAASSLGKKHKFNLLFLYILSLAKYPTAVKMLGASLSKLPAKFTLKDLHRVLERFLKEWCTINDTEQVQEEMIRYDDQRQSPHMGVPRMMQKLGLLTKVEPGQNFRDKARLKRKTTQGSLFPLGHGKPRLTYKFTGQTGQLTVAYDSLGDAKLAEEEELTKHGVQELAQNCFARLQEMEAALSQANSTSKTSDADCTRPVKRNLTEHGSNPSTGKEKAKGKAKGKATENVKSVDSTKAPYIHQHTVRKIVHWRMQEHDEAGTNRLDFKEWSLKELACIVPDQSKTLLTIDASECATVQQLADKTQQLPLMATCGLCLIKPLLVDKNKEQLRVLCNPRNRPLVVETIKEYVQKFNMPPPPVHLGSLVLKQLLFRATSPISGEAQAADKDKKDDEKALAGHDNNTSADNNTCADTGAGQDKAPGNEKELPDKASVVPPSSGKVQDAGKDKGALEESASADKQDGAFRWYRIPWVPGSTTCECVGNCGAGCAARTREDGVCPNPVSKESKKEFLAAKKLVRCQACRCQYPGCLSASRRPFGISNLCESFGRCMRHWIK